MLLKIGKMQWELVKYFKQTYQPLKMQVCGFYKVYVLHLM